MSSAHETATVEKSDLKDDGEIRRKEAGLEWMLRAPERPEVVSGSAQAVHDDHTLDSEKPKPHERELNPYINTGAEGNGEERMPKSSVSVVGDGGASWRSKQLKRAREQAAREGRRLEEVVEERWDSLQTLTSTFKAQRSAPERAHVHAARKRKSGLFCETDRAGANSSKELYGVQHDGSHERSERHKEHGSQNVDRWVESHGGNRDHGAQDGHREHHSRQRHEEHGSKMKVPRVDSTLSWKNRTIDKQSNHSADAADKIVRGSKGSHCGEDHGDHTPSRVRPVDDSNCAEKLQGKEPTSESFDVVYQPTRLIDIIGKELKSSDDEQKLPGGKTGDPPSCPTVEGKSSGLSANQVAAKAMRLRLMGKQKEADELLRDFEASSKDKLVQGSSTLSEKPRQVKGRELSTVPAQVQFHARTKSCDVELAESISRNKLYKGNEDDEYDGFGGALETERSHERKVSKKKLGDMSLKQSNKNDYRQMASKQEQCPFCFENTHRPKHLVIAIANFTVLMMPTFTPLVPLHCCIVPMQHEGATRNVDDNIWQELRNFKKCLVQMFTDQGRGVLFLETAMGLARQRRHCYVECIPVPLNILEDAPLYFKQAIDEAEDEWSQHNAKKLIDTRKKDLRNSIPKGFPYFHVEFGMQGGYCHVIDDESTFSPKFGVEVVAGMLELIPENASGHKRKDSVEQQKIEVKEFLKLWEPFDWTKMLD